MTAPIALYWLRNLSELRSGVVGSDSLAWLAQRRPTEYLMRDFSAGAEHTAGPGPAALHFKLTSLEKADGMDLLAQVTWALTRPGVHEWINAGRPLVFDHSSEASISALKRWHELAQIFQEQGFVRGRFIWLMQNELAPALCAEAFAGQTSIRMEPVVLHSWLHQTRLHVETAPRRPKRKDREVRFVNLNGKLRSHRAVVLGWLLNEGLLDRGLVSLGERSAGSGPLAMWPDFQALQKAARQDFPGFEKEIAACSGLVGRLHLLDEQQIRPFDILWHQQARAGFSLVSETDMRGRRLRRFTEKTLKALAAWHPIVLAGNMGTLRLLRDYGFQTFSPAIDESYDLIEAPAERLRAVLAEARRLITMPEEEFDRLLDELDPVLEHNHRHFMDGLPAIMDRQHQAVQRAVAEVGAA